MQTGDITQGTITALLGRSKQIDTELEQIAKVVAQKTALETEKSRIDAAIAALKGTPERKKSGPVPGSKRRPRTDATPDNTSSAQANGSSPTGPDPLEPLPESSP